MAYSMDLRRRASAMSDQGPRHVARVLGGQLVVGAAAHEAPAAAEPHPQPDATLAERRQRPDVHCTLSSLCETLKHLKLTFKQDPTSTRSSQRSARHRLVQTLWRDAQCMQPDLRFPVREAYVHSHAAHPHRGVRGSTAKISPATATPRRCTT
jgi:hypothetical protein